MNKIKPTGLEYSVGDTFEFEVTPAKGEMFSTGSTLTLVISKRETEEALIEKTFILEIDRFLVTLNDSEKALIPMGEYIYKMIIHTAEGVISTQKSGFLDVIWGA